MKLHSYIYAVPCNFIQYAFLQLRLGIVDKLRVVYGWNLAGFPLFDIFMIEKIMNIRAQYIHLKSNIQVTY